MARVLARIQNIGSVTVAQVKEAHSAYVADRQTYYVIALKKQGKE